MRQVGDTYYDNGVIFILYLHIPVQYHTLNDKMYWDELYKQQ